MQTRKEFIANASMLTAGSMLFPSLLNSNKRVKNTGVQLYTFRTEMTADARGTLKKGF